MVGRPRHVGRLGTASPTRIKATEQVEGAKSHASAGWNMAAPIYVQADSAIHAMPNAPTSPANIQLSLNAPRNAGVAGSHRASSARRLTSLVAARAFHWASTMAI